MQLVHLIFQRCKVLSSHNKIKIDFSLHSLCSSDFKSRTLYSSSDEISSYFSTHFFKSSGFPSLTVPRPEVTIQLYESEKNTWISVMLTLHLVIQMY